MMPENDFNKIAFEYNTAQRRLIILNYEGCLVSYDTYPCETTPNFRVDYLLQRLTQDAHNSVMVISDFDKDSLSRIMTNPKLFLIADGGRFYREPGDNWKVMPTGFNDWMPSTLPALRALSFVYEGSFVEEEDNSIRWNYSTVTDLLSEDELAQISTAIRNLPESKYFKISNNNSAIELRTTGIAKSLLLAGRLSTNEYDFVMAMGDGNTNEYLFNDMTEDTCLVNVGEPIRSSGNFQIESQEEVLPFLKKLIQVNREFNQVMPFFNLSLYRLN